MALSIKSFQKNYINLWNYLISLLKKTQDNQYRKIQKDLPIGRSFCIASRASCTLCPNPEIIINILSDSNYMSEVVSKLLYIREMGKI